MKILVCFRVIRDTENLCPEELSALCRGEFNMSVLEKVYSGYDASALEAALRLRDEAVAHGVELSLHALTASECEHRFALNLFALGFASVAVAQPSIPAFSSPAITAEFIDNYICSGSGFDMVLLGKQAYPEEDATLPVILADKLGFPCIENVSALSLGQNHPHVVFRTDQGFAECDVCAPVVYAFGEAEHPFLRSPLLRDRLSAQHMAVDMIAVSDHADVGAYPEYVSSGYDATEKHCEFWAADDLNRTVEKLKSLFSAQED